MTAEQGRRRNYRGEYAADHVIPETQASDFYALSVRGLPMGEAGLEK